MIARRVLVVIALGLASGACYSYRPVEAVAPGMTVRARLTPAAAVRESESRAEVLRQVEGEVVAARADSIALDFLLARGSSGGQMLEFRDTLRLARSELTTLEVRQLSLLRTTIAAAGVAALGFVMMDRLTAGGDSGEDGGSGTRQAVLPLSDWLRALLRAGGR